NDLALLGYDVKIYEALPKPGGMLTYGIPEYRLPNEIVQGEIDDIQSLGVEVQCDTRIGDDVTLDDLRNKHDAVFLATGADISRKLGIEGEEAEGVIHAVNLLRNHELGKDVQINGRVVVIGGGNAAIDAARTCLRLGAEDVMILYRRTRIEMPAAHEEIEEAIEEGVRIEFLAAPTKVLSEGGKVTGLQCIRMELGEPDESGRRRPVPIAGSEHTVEADIVIPAISQDADLSYAGGTLARTKWGTIEVDERYATNIDGVFAGGDACTGPNTVVEAMGAGKRAAENIHRYLRGEELIAFPKLEPAHYDEVGTDVEKAARVHQPMPDARERIKTFDEVRENFTEEQAKAEAERCLNCAVCSECQQCVIACKPEAILHGEQDEELEISAGATGLRGVRCPHPGRIRLRPPAECRHQHRVRAHPLGHRPAPGPCAPAVGRRRAEEGGVAAVRRLAGPSHRPRLLLVGLLHVCHERGGHREGARPRAGADDLLHGHALLRQGLRAVLQPGEG
ncbi:MAG: FAD-dependent oxidoreductase, partial [Planctomycetes bacterium]|nr:FAD-dependent oxidoreductase [Planctomycetota bacterium]